MEDITKNLRAFLLDDAGIATAFGTRIYVNLAPDKTAYPYALIKRVAESSLHTITDRFGSEAIIQIDVYDDDLEDCMTNANLIEEEIAGHSGAVEDIDECLIFTTNIMDSWIPDQRIFRCMIQAEVKRTV